MKKKHKAFYKNNIAKILREQGKTQAWLSRELGITRASVSRMCSNNTNPDTERSYKICKLLGVTIEDLFYIEGNE